MYYLGEAIPAAGVSLFTADLAKSSPIQVLLLLIMNSDIYLHTHQSVVLQYFEIIVRYAFSDKFKYSVFTLLFFHSVFILQI